MILSESQGTQSPVTRAMSVQNAQSVHRAMILINGSYRFSLLTGESLWQPLRM